MSKKDFVSLAMHLANGRPFEGEVAEVESDIEPSPGVILRTSLHTWNESIKAVADSCALSSPRFDRDRFLDACRTWLVVVRDGRLVRVTVPED